MTASQFHAYAPASSRATLPETITTAIRRYQERTGRLPQVITVNHHDATGLTGPLGTTVNLDARVARGNCWLSDEAVKTCD